MKKAATIGQVVRVENKERKWGGSPTQFRFVHVTEGGKRTVLGFTEHSYHESKLLPERNPEDVPLYIDSCVEAAVAAQAKEEKCMLWLLRGGLFGFVVGAILTVVVWVFLKL